MKKEKNKHLIAKLRAMRKTLLESGDWKRKNPLFVIDEIEDWAQDNL